MKTHVARVNKPVIAACYLTQICKSINSRALYDCFIGNFVTNWYFLSAEIDRKSFDPLQQAPGHFVHLHLDRS